MTDDFPSSNKMIGDSAAKKPFHFSGDGIYHNLTIWAEDIEKATEDWLAKRKIISEQQSTPEQKEATEDHGTIQ